MLSLTMAPCGQAAAMSVRRRTTVAGSDISRPSSRNSVGVSATSTSPDDESVPCRVEHGSPGFLGRGGRGTPEQRVQPDA